MTSFTRLASHISFIVASCLLAAVVDSSSAHAAEAGVDGDHIYAGVSYSSIESYDRCEWVRPITIHEQGVSPSVVTRQWQGITWSLYVCARDGTDQFAWLPEITTEEVAESTRSVVRELIPMLTENFSPVPHRGVVKTPTWFWVNPLLWRPVSVTAYVPTPRGVLAVTTTATPESLEFSPGDGIGDTVECDGPGTPWTSLLPKFIHSECQYEYPVPSSVRNDGIYRARLDTVWKITWRTNVGVSGRLPDVRLGATHAMRIRELHAVVKK